MLIGSQGMRFSLQSREIIADSIETVTCAQYHDACVAVPGFGLSSPLHPFRGVLTGIKMRQEHAGGSHGDGEAQQAFADALWRVDR